MLVCDGDEELDVDGLSASFAYTGVLYPGSFERGLGLWRLQYLYIHNLVPWEGEWGGGTDGEVMDTVTHEEYARDFTAIAGSSFHRIVLALALSSHTRSFSRGSRTLIPAYVIPC